MKIAIVGDLGIDYYKNLNLLKPGGIAFNFAFNLMKSGKNNVSLISILGKDTLSLKLLKISKKVGLDISHIQQTGGNAPKQNIYLDSGERKFTGYDPGVLKKWKFRKKDLLFISKHDVVFVPLNDGMDHIFHAIAKLKGVIKCADFSQDSEFADFDKKNNVITKNTKYFDIVFIGGMKKHQKMIEKLAKEFPNKVFVLTLGAAGSIGFYQNNIFTQRSIKPSKIVDTTGCGDAFQAGFLTKWLKTNNMKESLLFGSKMASLKISHIGAVPLNV